jgi:predicted kinase
LNTEAEKTMLLILGGLPGTGKTTIARELARQMRAIHLRIDSIEQVIRDWSKNEISLEDVGYRVAYSIAEENLRLGVSVVADSVNPIALTRECWRQVGQNTRSKTCEVEIVCSDAAEHRHRVENRSSDILGLELPNWQQVVERRYEIWREEHLVIDTAKRSVEESVGILQNLFEK